MYAGLHERCISLAHPVRGKTNKKVLTQLFCFFLSTAHPVCGPGEMGAGSADSAHGASHVTA